jgi:hypothetical protein
MIRWRPGPESLIFAIVACLVIVMLAIVLVGFTAGAAPVAIGLASPALLGFAVGRRENDDDKRGPPFPRIHS